MSPGDGRGRPGEGAPTNPDVKFASTLTAPTDGAGLTREDFTEWHNWLADSHDVERTRLGYAVFVRTNAGTYRRRLYLALDSAYRAIERAERRGVEAHAVLVELRQVGDLR